MSIVTRQGDGGTTRLIFGAPVSKADLQVEAYGTIDEMNSFLGLARSGCDSSQTADTLEILQRESFVVGAELATPPDKRAGLKSRVDDAMIARLEELVAQIELTPGLLDDWALPGGTPVGAALDCARTVARRAERCVVRLHNAGIEQTPQMLRYLNRISDVIWLLGRRYELQHGVRGALREGA